MWLLKTEPSAYSFEDLEKDVRTVWDGIANPAALKNLRQMKAGDRIFVYHTGNAKAVVGLARVVREAYPDPAGSDPKRVVIDIEREARLETPVALAELKSLPSFAGSPLVRQGRLSVVPLSKAQWQAIEKRGTPRVARGRAR
jgi:predicted RNA-binding protein with PUA-like domain